jgi:hypothetical protein
MMFSIGRNFRLVDSIVLIMMDTTSTFRMDLSNANKRFKRLSVVFVFLFIVFVLIVITLAAIFISGDNERIAIPLFICIGSFALIVAYAKFFTLYLEYRRLEDESYKCSQDGNEYNRMIDEGGNEGINEPLNVSDPIYDLDGNLITSTKLDIVEEPPSSK